MRRRAKPLHARWYGWPNRCYDDVIDGQEVSVIDTYNERGECVLRCIYPRGA